MKKIITNHLLTILGWFFVILGAIGAVLPVLPTTPFLILALALFSKSSPRFHQMLINNQWFGPALQQWEEEKTLARATKKKATALILVTFAISLALLIERPYLQFTLVGIMIGVLMFIWRIKEPDSLAQHTKKN